MPLRAHLRYASVYPVTIKSASYGRPYGMWNGMHVMSVVADVMYNWGWH